MTVKNLWNIGRSEVVGNTQRTFITGERPGGFELFFETEGDLKPAADDGTAALITTLIPAMRCGADINCESPVDPLLLRRIPGIQRILTTWFPTRLKPVKITAMPGPFRKPEASASATFFSGGVDSWYSLIGNRGILSHAILVTGFDFRNQQTRLAEEIRTRLEPAVESYGVRLTGVKTNLRDFTDPHTDWAAEQHGAALAAVAAVLSPHFWRILIPGTYIFTVLDPHGSHPVLDPLWSTTGTEIIHHGVECNRSQKIGSMTDEQLAINNLRVCYENPGDAYNCGQCGKCMLTMLAWLIADSGATSFPSFANRLNPENIARYRITDHPMEVAYRMRLNSIHELGGTRPDLLPYAEALRAALQETVRRRAPEKFFGKFGLTRLRRMMKR